MWQYVFMAALSPVAGNLYRPLEQNIARDNRHIAQTPKACKDDKQDGHFLSHGIPMSPAQLAFACLQLRNLLTPSRHDRTLAWRWIETTPTFIADAICVLPFIEQGGGFHLVQVQPPNNKAPFVCWKNILANAPIEDHCILALHTFGIPRSDKLDVHIRRALDQASFTMQVKDTSVPHGKPHHILYILLNITDIPCAPGMKPARIPVYKLLGCANTLGYQIPECLKKIFDIPADDTCVPKVSHQTWTNAVPDTLTKHPLFFLLPFFNMRHSMAPNIQQLSSSALHELQNISFVQSALRDQIIEAVNVRNET